MYEVNEAARVITSSADPSAKVIFGTVIDEDMSGEVKITVIATGFGKGSRPATRKVPQAASTPFEAPVQTKSERTSSPAPAFAPASIPRPTPPARETVGAGMDKSREEEDLEIPAFIRKKML